MSVSKKSKERKSGGKTGKEADERMAVREVLGWLKAEGSAKGKRELDRYGIVAKRAYGVPMRTLQKMSKEIGADHGLARELWKSGWYVARLLAALVGEPERVTREEMRRWAGSFENWADCDTVCFKLWDRTEHAWEMSREWAASPREFVKRGGFALMACLALHDKTAGDKWFAGVLPLIERGARDERNFVKKGVSWALRSIGRRSGALNGAAVAVAKRLTEAEDASSRWIGRDAVRELEGRKVQAALARREKKRAKG